MGYGDAIILGLIQGITEFLPISSSGHLVLIREFLGIRLQDGFVFDIFLHVSTLFVILIYFHKKIFDLARTAIGVVMGQSISREDTIIIGGIIIGTIPAVIVGVLWEDIITRIFRDSLWVAGALIVGSLLFLLAERVGKQDQELSFKKGLVIGLFQALAFIPGISRSGITISGGLFSGISRKKAAEFSFLLAIPAIAGAGVKEVLFAEGMFIWGPEVILGALTAFISGFCAIHFLMKFLQNHSLSWFVGYRMILALIVIGVMVF